MNECSPYSNLPPRNFWKSGVAEQVPTEVAGLYQKRFAITTDEPIATAGSCFAQHISRHLKSNGCNVMDVEPPPPGLTLLQAQEYGYELYSARYGNIYHVRQLLQLAKEAFGIWSPVDAIWERNGRWFDAMRPSVEPGGLPSKESVVRHRKNHLNKVKGLFENARLFIFTLGLTEAWQHRASGTIYPTAPGTIAGKFDPTIHQFVNFGCAEIVQDFIEFRTFIKDRNPHLRFLLTVSPVPLVATASDQHVLVATTYSKSVLRAAAGQIYQQYDDVDYFPSYEIIASHFSRGMFFHPNLRSVTQAGVEAVMRVFFEQHRFALCDGAEVGSKTSCGSKQLSQDDVICEEVLLEAFGS